MYLVQVFLRVKENLENLENLEYPFIFDILGDVTPSSERPSTKLPLLSFSRFGVLMVITHKCEACAKGFTTE